jgi:hypothetical protein
VKFPLRGRASRLAIAGLLAVAASVGIYLAVPSSGSSASAYGTLPSWLPTATIPVGRVVTASPGHPALAIEGDTVRVVLPHGSALATLVGPQVPPFKIPIPQTVKTTFILTLGHVTGTVPDSGLILLDAAGHAYRPVITRHGDTLTLTAVMATGSGQLRWAPAGKVVVSWEFSVEVD